MDGTRVTRREALGYVAAAGLGVVSGLKSELLFAQAQGAPAPPAPDPYPNKNFPNVPAWKTELRELAPNVYGYIQGGGPGVLNAGVSNGGCIAGPDQWLAIDALQGPIPAKAFIAAAEKATGKKCSRLVNTHHHGDHTAGNQFFGDVEIVSHEYCYSELVKQAAAAQPGAKFPKREGNADGTEIRRVAVPTTSFNAANWGDKLTYHVGNTVVEILYAAPAHTYGDLMAYLPQYKILFAGDVFFNYVCPFGQNAHVTSWLAILDRINAMDVDVIVPGHGPIGNKKELAEMGNYFKLLKTEARTRFAAGMSAGKAAAEISTRMGKFENWIGPNIIITNVVRLYHEFAGTQVPDTDPAGVRAATAEFNAAKGIRPS